MELMCKQTELDSTINELNLKVNEVDTLVSELFSSLNSLVNHGYWQGISANKYFNHIKYDNYEFKELTTYIRKYIDALGTTNEKIKNNIDRYGSGYDKNLYKQ
jgi:uncharacterized protein YukE